jgi:TetR/AcrR family transcriptional regulator, fatty acid metabolism regulator protein
VYQMQRALGEIALGFATLQRIVKRGQDRGVFRSDVSPRLAAWIVYGALEEILTGWVMGTLIGEEADVAEAERAVVLILCDGLVTG